MEAMKKLVFATNNAHKLEEIRHILSGKVEVLSLRDIECDDEIEETGTTLEENALIKARYIYQKYGLDCFADDTGLLVDALDGRPGVYSARYAGPNCSPADNRALMLRELDGVPTPRTAHFTTVIALIEAGQETLFTGSVQGEITTEERGEEGFGYDPIFCPVGYRETFAELGGEVKNLISHRARAVAKLVNYLLRK